MTQWLHYKEHTLQKCIQHIQEEYSIGALLTAAQNWKQPRCSLTVEWIPYDIYTVIQ